MITVNLEKIKDLYCAGILHELHIVREKIEIYAAKYNSDFQTFEDELNKLREENFEKWDDYMEWKGYEKALEELNIKIKDIENGNIKVA